MIRRPAKGSGRHLLALTRYGPDLGSSRVRFYQFLPSLEQQGWQVTFKPLQRTAFHLSSESGTVSRIATLLRDYARRLPLILRARRFNAIWVEKELFPYLPATLERWLTTRGVPVIVDYDDATFHVYDEHPNEAVRSVLGRKIDAVMRMSTLTIAGNTYIAERAFRAGARKVATIPSSVDSTRYEPYAVRSAGRTSDQPQVIGWIGSPSTAKYLKLIGPALAKVQKSSNARVVLVGSGSLDIADVELEILPWNESTEVGLIQSFDVGIMPIATTSWERGKCGFKLIQYMASGIPSVATAFGANNDITLHGRTGFLAETHEDWVKHMSQLLSSDTMRKSMGHEGRERVRGSYSIETNGPKLLGAFEQALAQ